MIIYSKIMKFVVILILSLLSFNCFSQSSNRFFSKEKLTQTGVYYYPEQWNESQWDRDIQKIAEMGFEYIHVGEFAWVFMEPKEGRYDFKWLDKVVGIADKYGLKVLLCTPTPCPPAWMAATYPEIFSQNSAHQSMEHGSRENCSTSDEIYRSFSEKIVTQLAQRYGKDKRIIGWQLDNEPSRGIDYSPAAQKKFRQWLMNKYKNIDELNRVWGGAFWSTRYDNFEQIKIPNDNMYGISPHALLDSKRFSIDQLADFLDLQAITLRKYISGTQWIMTNYMGINNNCGFDPTKTKFLDFTCYTNYPVHGTGEMLGEKGFRMGSMSGLAFLNDYHRSVFGQYGVMELQPGQTDWGTVNPQPEPGAINMWLWHTFAGGTVLNCTYRYRHPIYGSELHADGIVGTDGTTPSRGGNEFAAYIAAVKKLRKLYNPDKHGSTKYLNRKTAILTSFDNLWNQDNAKIKFTVQWDPMGHLSKYYKIAKSFGCPVDFVRESSDWSNYKVLIVPAYEMVSTEVIDKIRKFAAAGGQVIMSCRTGQMDKDGHLWQDKPSAPIYKLIGAEIPFNDELLPDGKGEVAFNHINYAWNNWADILDPCPGTEVLASYANQFYKNRSAAVHHKIDHGAITYIGVDTDNGDLEKSIMRKVYQDAQIAIENYPEGIDVEYRDGFWVGVNYSSKTYRIQLPANAKVIVGNEYLTSPGVIVWTED